MPRPKRQRVYAPEGASFDTALASLQPDINRLLTVANAGHTNVRHVLEKLRATPMLPGKREREVRLELGLRGRWPQWAVFALINLYSNIRSGDYHLRRCSECTSWMLVKDDRHRLCPRTICKRAANTRQQTARLQVLRELERAAIARANSTF